MRTLDNDITYGKCHVCNTHWEPYYGVLSIKDDVSPAIIIYTCINCIPDEGEE